MNESDAKRARYGPWLVGLGAALWGTESAWRIPLNDLFDARVIVFWEHVLILLMFLPLLIPRLGELRKIEMRTWGYLLFSGFAGSAVGTIFFTLALKNGNPTVVNVILNIQPVISTLGAFVLFRDKLTPRFFVFASITIIAGIFLSVEHPELICVSFEEAGLNRGTTYALICALFWGLSTVAGRGVMTGMSLRLGSSLRIVVGLICMTVILLVSGQFQGTALWPAAAQAETGKAIGALVLLASISGAIPLLIYFEGLRLTRASTAGYFEMMQTLAAVCITWGFFSCNPSSAPGGCGPDSDGSGRDVTEKRDVILAGVVAKGLPARPGGSTEISRLAQATGFTNNRESAPVAGCAQRSWTTRTILSPSAKLDRPVF